MSKAAFAPPLFCHRWSRLSVPDVCAGALFIPTPRNSQDNVLPQFTHGKSPATACTCTNGNGNGKVSLCPVAGVAIPP